MNLIELAPKGTGKSYLFGGVSRYGYLSAGKMTRAKLFYDLARREEGLVFIMTILLLMRSRKLSLIMSMK